MAPPVPSLVPRAAGTQKVPRPVLSVLPGYGGSGQGRAHTRNPERLNLGLEGEGVGECGGGGAT